MLSWGPQRAHQTKKEDPGAIPDPTLKAGLLWPRWPCNMAARGSWEFPRRQIFLSSLNLYGAQNTLEFLVLFWFLAIFSDTGCSLQAHGVCCHQHPHGGIGTEDRAFWRHPGGTGTHPDNSSQLCPNDEAYHLLFQSDTLQYILLLASGSFLSSLIYRFYEWAIISEY